MVSHYMHFNDFATACLRLKPTKSYTSEKGHEKCRPLKSDLLICHVFIIYMAGITRSCISSQGVPSAVHISRSHSLTVKRWDGSPVRKGNNFPPESVPLVS